jgi:hypothetical protein
MATMTQDQPITATQSTRLPGVDYDENGQPIGYTVNEVFDQFDREMIATYGEYGRQLVNESRTKWNKQGPWKFELF